MSAEHFRPVDRHYTIESHTLDAPRPTTYEEREHLRTWLWNCYRSFRELVPSRGRQNLVMLWEDDYTELRAKAERLAALEEA